MNFFGIGTTEKFTFAMPPLQEQKRIGNALTSIVEKIDRLSNRLESHKTLKKALMQDLLTGKVRVNA